MNNINQQIKKFILLEGEDEKKKMKLNCIEKYFYETYLTGFSICDTI
jgi:hypothetical protein